MEPLLSPTSCSAATCKAVVTSRGYISPRIAVLENQIPGEPVDIRGRELFDVLHRTSYVVERRYTLSCLCEEIPLAIAGTKNSITVGPKSIIPPSLATAATDACGVPGR